ncbi:MAG: hypothetical protein ACD_19C00182G0078 [uncultured bacterium]|nr:MAG: hypothetical protein ACD_19C00182G0078 [uncultured bacterium]
MERRVDLTERDLRIALTQARGKGDKALKIAQENLDKHLSTRLTFQLQHTRMAIAANRADKQVIQGINEK